VMPGGGGSGQKQRGQKNGDDAVTVHANLRGSGFLQGRLT
jgi:hypothetical protein